MTYNIPSYWKSANLGDPKLAEFFGNAEDGWIVEEKIDGSQVSFCVVGDELCIRSKGKQIDLQSPEKLFSKLVNVLVGLHSVNAIPHEIILRGEAVTSEKHNTLKYSRTPEKYVVIFGAEDVFTGQSMTREYLERLCASWGFEVAPLLDTWKGTGVDLYKSLQSHLSRTSMLGGSLVEGVVVKRVGKQVYYMDRPVFAKLVSEEFREQHKVSWSVSNPGKEDVIQQLVLELSGPARYAKAVQHLKESGTFEGSLRDIGNLIKEVKRDIVEEGESHAKQVLWSWAKDKIARGAGAGVPQWWKDKLANQLEEQLEGAANGK
jgi:hypothetical protein